MVFYTVVALWSYAGQIFIHKRKQFSRERTQQPAKNLVAFSKRHHHGLLSLHFLFLHLSLYHTPARVPSGLSELFDSCFSSSLECSPSKDAGCLNCFFKVAVSCASWRVDGFFSRLCVLSGSILWIGVLQLRVCIGVRVEDNNAVSSGFWLSMWSMDSLQDYSLYQGRLCAIITLATCEHGGE